MGHLQSIFPQHPCYVQTWLASYHGIVKSRLLHQMLDMPRKSKSLVTQHLSGKTHCIAPIHISEEDVLYIVSLSQRVVLLQHYSEAGVLERLLSVFHAVLHAAQSLG